MLRPAQLVEEPGRDGGLARAPQSHQRDYTPEWSATRSAQRIELGLPPHELRSRRQRMNDAMSRRM
jgi:hypothetical protein